MWHVSNEHQHLFVDLRDTQNVTAWQGKHNLRVPWVCVYATRLLESWRLVMPESTLPGLLVWGEFEDIEPVPSLEFPEPFSWQSEEGYLRRVKEMALEFRNRYAQIQGWESEPMKMREEQKHFRWLVKYQCFGLGWAKIAAEEKLSKVNGKRVGNTVSSAVKSVAAKLKVPLRESKKGR